jgi:hypothetical protein
VNVNLKCGDWTIQVLLPDNQTVEYKFIVTSREF